MPRSYTQSIKSATATTIIADHHQLDPFTFILGDFATVSATATTLYLTATVVDADGKPTGETLPATTPDQCSIHGLLKSGALATVIWRTGYPTTQGRRFLGDGRRNGIDQAKVR
ncbi:hypothetical protein BDZ97DRAFT_753723 [Flammula alnicola]|nr:hypothetical protein BDZ97DRAFT_753723 [Flammula alnicola]